MHLITWCSFNVNIFCLQSECLKDFQWHTLVFCILSFLNYMQLSLNESQNMMTGCFLPSLYFWFATFKTQFNGNLLSGWKITVYFFMWPCASETGCWMAMGIFHILSVWCSVKSVSLSFCVKSQEGGCSCKQEKGEAQSRCSELWGEVGAGWLNLGGLDFGPSWSQTCAS